jgi:hypothetical protein
VHRIVKPGIDSVRIVWHVSERRLARAAAQAPGRRGA